MSCESIQPDLVALAQHELAPALEQEAQAHLGNCPACREEFEQFRAVLKASKRVELVEPSAVFRKNLEKRISEAIEHTRRNQLRKRPGSTGVRLPSVLAAPGRAEEARASSRRASAPESAAPGPRRFPVRRAEEPRGRRLQYVALAGASACLVVALSFFFLAPRAQPPSNPQAARLAQAVERWNQRREAPSWDKILDGNQIALPHEATQAQVLHLMPGNGPDAREVCVVAFADAEVEKWRAQKKIPEGLRQLLEGAKRVAVQDGKITLPADCSHTLLGGSGTRVRILKLEDRIEIWPASACERYLGTKPTAESLPEAASIPEAPAGE